MLALSAIESLPFTLGDAHVFVQDVCDASDVAFFAEPAWSSTGGDALAYVWSSWDGVSWEKTAEFEVESVDTAAHITAEDCAREGFPELSPSEFVAFYRRSA